MLSMHKTITVNLIVLSLHDKISLPISIVVSEIYIYILKYVTNQSLLT